MQGFLEKLSGRKTYGFAVLLVLLAVVDLGGLLPAEHSTAIYAAVVAGLAAALRSAVSKALPGLEVGEESLDPDGTTSIERPPSNFSGAAMLLLCLFVPAIAGAEDVRIVGPTSVPAAGYPCELFIQGDIPPGTVVGWDYFPRTDGLQIVKPSEDGLSARLSTVAGTYKLIAAVTFPGEKPIFRYHDFTSPGTPYVPPTPPAPQPQPVPPSPPPPTPGPTPAPEPTFAPGEFGMAEATYRAVLAVNSTRRRTEATCLASKLADLLQGIQGRSIATPQAAVNAIAAAFDGCLSPPWDAARDRLTDRVGELIAARRLVTMQHWQTLATEALEGLNAAAAR